MVDIEPIRSPNTGFSNEAETYLQKLASAKLPAELEYLSHTIPWPVDMSNPLAHIACYFGDINYSDPTYEKPHNGVDIQVPLGTPIIVPEPSILVYVDSGHGASNIRRQLSDLLLHGESGLAYWLAHIDTSSLSPELIDRVRHNYNSNSGIRLNQGDVIGKVGIFFGKEMQRVGINGLSFGIPIPNDVERVYIRSFNHIHIMVQYPQLGFLDYYSRDFNGNDKYTVIDPLPILKRLY